MNLVFTTMLPDLALRLIKRIGALACVSKFWKLNSHINKIHERALRIQWHKNKFLQAFEHGYIRNYIFKKVAEIYKVIKGIEAITVN